MKALIVMLLALPAALGAAVPTIELTGVLKSSGTATVSLTDQTTHVSKWVRVGQVFENYKVSSYDTHAEAVTLIGENGPFTVTLKSAKVKPGELAQPLSKSSALAIYNNLRQLSAAFDRYRLEHGTTTAKLEDLVGEKNYIRRLDPIAGEDYGTVKFQQGHSTYTVTAASGDTVTFDLTTPTSGSFYRIAPGDTGAKVAAKAGMTLSDLHSLNDDMDFARLKVGDFLRLR